jgi:mannose-6-phosphate isomerase
MLYPLKFHPILKEKIWGGRELESLLGKALPTDRPVGESWEISDLPGNESRVRNGRLAGQTIGDLLRRYPEEILGAGCDNRKAQEPFPLLLKFIDASARLSLQVHPGDEYARIHEGGRGGKWETWHVLWASPEAEIILGLHEGVGRATLLRAIREKTVEQLVNRFRVEAGDTVLIPPGTLHSVGGRLLLFEIQQPSDLTYRVYDWGRTGLDGRPRSLHLEKALDVIDFDPVPLNTLQPRPLRRGKVKSDILVAIDAFTLKKVEIEQNASLEEEGGEMQTLSIIGGSGRIRYGSGPEERVGLGETALIPASLGSFSVGAGPGGIRLLSAHP